MHFSSEVSTADTNRKKINIDFVQDNTKILEITKII